jgi:hypothetical protein
MYASRYRAVLDHLQQSVAILGPSDPENQEVHSALVATIALLDKKLSLEISRNWDEAVADEQLVRLDPFNESAGLKDCQS